MTLISLLLEQASKNPARTAIVENNKQISFLELSEQSALMAQALKQQNIGRGDKILVAVWPSIQLYITLAALWRLGATAVFPEAATGLKGLCYAAQAIKPKTIIAGNLVRVVRLFVPELRAIKNFISPTIRSRNAFLEDCSQQDDGALISFTSGTTGAPKAMERSHALLLAQHEALSSVLASANHEIDLVAFPALALSCLGHGHTVVLPNWNMKHHDKASLSALMEYAARHSVTRLIAPPTIIEKFNEKDAGIIKKSALKSVITGGGPVYPDVMRNFSNYFSFLQLVILYGSTEAEPISHLYVSDMTEKDWKNISQGKGIPVGQISRHAKVLLGKNNEILVAGAHVNESYMDKSRNIETKLLIDGKIYHRTGDIGSFDDKGQLWLAGRLGTMLGDVSPFALEVEARLQPGIKGAAAMVIDNKIVLAIEGNAQNIQTPFKQYLDRKGVLLAIVDFIPKDMRHRSKVDYNRLNKILNKKYPYL